MRSVIAAALSAALAAGLLTAAAPGAAAAGCPVPIAHKGLHWPYSGYPENSLGGEQDAFKAGAPWVETDVHTSRDGAWIIMHDWTVDRTTTHTGLVSSYTAAQLGAMRLTQQPNVEDPTTSFVPALARFLQIARWNHGHVEVEISPGSLSGGQLAAFIREYDSQAGWKYDRVSSYYPAVLAQVRHADPRIKTDLLLFGGFAPSQGSVQEDIGWPYITAALVARLHRDRVAVNAGDGGPGGGAAVWPALARDGVDQIDTDNVRGYLAFQAAGCR